MIYKILQTVFTAALAFSLAACSGGSSGNESANEAGVLTTRPSEMIVALQSDGKSLDPHLVNDAASMRMIENMYDTLLRYGPGYGQLEPGLAREWNISGDGRTYTFFLDTNAHFHVSGRSVGAEDVVFSINRIKNEGERAFHFETVENITASNHATVVITLSEPLAPFLTYVAHPMNAIVDSSAMKGAEGLQRTDGGSGPFKLVEWKKDRHLVLEKHDAYHLPGKPLLDKVVFRPIADETARTTALRNSEIDIILDVAAKDIGILENASGIRVVSVPGTFWEYLGLNCTRKPFEDVRVRQAVAHAVDRELVNKLVKFGRATTLTGGHIPPNHWAHANVNLYPERNIEKAKALLASAGYENGFETTILVGSEFAYQVQAAEIIKQQLREAGISVTVQSLESGIFFNALGQKDFDMTVVGWLGFVDPDEWTYNLFKTGAMWNQQGYSNERVDELLEQGRVITEQQGRKPVYDEVQRIVAAQAPMVFLYVNDRTSAMLDSVKDFQVHPTVTTLSLRDTYRKADDG